MNLKKAFGLILITSLAASTQTASAQEKWYIKKGSVACLTKELYDTQLSYVSSGVAYFCLP